MDCNELCDNYVIDVERLFRYIVFGHCEGDILVLRRTTSDKTYRIMKEMMMIVNMPANIYLNKSSGNSPHLHII